MKTLPRRFKTINEYIKSQPKDAARMLETLRQTIKDIAPNAKEEISYNMPAFKIDKSILLYFASYERHIGLYPYPSSIKAFKKEAAKYKTGKGSIQFPIGEKLPVPLIRKIITFRVKERQEKLKKLTRNKKARYG